MKIQEIAILYTIKLLIGETKGNTVTVILDLDDLEETPISEYLVENGYLDGCGHPSDAYEITERRIIEVKS